MLNRPSERVSASLQALQEASKAGGTATQVDCDLQDFSSVRNAAAEVKKNLKGKGLDALLNNAGAVRRISCVRFDQIRTSKTGVATRHS